MTKSKTGRRSTPVDREDDPEVLAFRHKLDGRSLWGQKTQPSKKHRENGDFKGRSSVDPSRTDVLATAVMFPRLF